MRNIPLTAYERQQITDLVDQAIQTAYNEVRGFVMPPAAYAEPKRVIGAYIAAFIANFTDWIGKTLLWARSVRAKHALAENQECEQRDNHVGMLRHFAKQAGVRVSADDMERVEPHIDVILELLRDTKNAGLIGVVILGVLEKTSEVFIPVLEEMGRTLGVADLTYTQAHGVADIEHSDAFIAAIKAEWEMGYEDPHGLMTTSVKAAVELLRQIFSQTEVPTAAST